MTRQQFNQAFMLAQQSLIECDDSVLYGLALPAFQPVTTTLEVCARFIRSHCMYLNGSWDSNELNEMAALMRRKVYICNSH